MPRSARRDSLNNNKIYHVILKGINSQEIFFEDSDRIKFLENLKHTKKLYKYDIYAYVLMSNHIHLLIYDEENNISQIMHRICTMYAMYFNKKYERTGHLFQNRFKSKCVNTDNYLLNLQRYIHRNPQNDYIDSFDKYKWSSYQEYISTKKITNTEFILNIFDEDKSKAIKKFIQYNKMNDEEYGIEEFEIRKNLTDEEAIEKIKEVLKIENIISIQNFNKILKNRYINEIFEIGGISKKQISRITGISSRTVQRAITGK